jgi:predicted ArsR family transcriptional regulator
VNIPDRLRERAGQGFGPAPRITAAAPGPPPTRSAHAILELLAAQPEPVTTAVLAELAGQHPNTVREHLDALVEGGLATRARATSVGRGRPSWLYSATPARTAAPEYAALATALAAQIARTSDRPHEEALAAGATWGRQLAAGTATAPSSPAEARRGVVAVLDGLGFAPSADPRSMVVRLRRCPLLDAALAEPRVVCAVHLGIVRGALDSWHTASDETGLAPFAEPGACPLHLRGATRRSAT